MPLTKKAKLIRVGVFASGLCLGISNADELSTLKTYLFNKLKDPQTHYVSHPYVQNAIAIEKFVYDANR
ncbi:MAG: hypothetical protein ACI8Y7_000849 [Candidatus Woesearchaeota archaeon]|jgi:hypothetical protein